MVIHGRQYNSLSDLICRPTRHSCIECLIEAECRNATNRRSDNFEFWCESSVMWFIAEILRSRRRGHDAMNSIFPNSQSYLTGGILCITKPSVFVARWFRSCVLLHYMWECTCQRAVILSVSVLKRCIILVTIHKTHQIRQHDQLYVYSGLEYTCDNT